mmetsp:Transcript_38551/g.47773  ORF Transcript_38551/g.47773 Transcript_38551/m.47773 type:complete len:244 (-) Transcript_38551:23-754(-)
MFKKVGKACKLEKWFIQYHSLSEPKIGVKMHKICVFVSVISLYKIYKDLSSNVIQYCILILPIHDSFLNGKFNGKYKDHPYFINNMYKDKDFVNLLRYKHSQNMCLFTYDYKDNKTDDCLINGDFFYDGRIKRSLWNKHNVSDIWYKISSLIENIYNPETAKKCVRLNLNIKYWKGNCQVLDELTYNNNAYKAMKLIINDTNPTLNVVSSIYDISDDKSMEYIYCSGSNSEGVWCISRDYIEN